MACELRLRRGGVTLAVIRRGGLTSLHSFTGIFDLENVAIGTGRGLEGIRLLSFEAP